MLAQLIADEGKLAAMGAMLGANASDLIPELVAARVLLADRLKMGFAARFKEVSLPRKGSCGNRCGRQIGQTVAFGNQPRLLRAKGVRVETGVFGALMDVELVNDGPVTLLWEDSR